MIDVLGTVAVRGPSMLPLLQDGDFLVVRWGLPPRSGDVVVAELRERPGLLVVKRATAAAAGGGWQLVSDNAGAPGAVGGVGDVQAVVVARYWPPGRIRRVPRGARRPGGPADPTG